MFRFMSVTVTLMMLAPGTLQAQADIYANSQNLQVLPADISADDLRNTMKEFALGTGLRCSSCHRGEEGQPLSEYDFVSDEKTLKQTAREMVIMENAINARHLEFLGPDRVTVTCTTCHRGVPKPTSTGE